MKPTSHEGAPRAGHRLSAGEPPPPTPIAAPQGVKVPAKSRSRRVGYAIMVGVLLVAGLVIVVRRGRSTGATAQPPPAVLLEGSRIRFTEEFATRHHVASAAATEAELSPTLQVMGTVQYDVRRFASVGARAAGRVRRVLKIVGDPVKVGDVLADIESVDLGKAQAAAEALRAKELAAETNLGREQRLAEAKVTALREVEAAKAEHQALRAERRAAEKAVAAFGASLDSQVGILPLRSPIAGRLIAAKVSRGQTVEPSDTLFEVADLSTVWVELTVFERDLGRVRVGDEVEILPAAAVRDTVRGRLAQVGDVVDPNTRSATARVEVDNRAGLLRPGQSTSARIHARAHAARAITIAKASVSFIDGKAAVLVLVGPGLVEPRPIELGADDGERVIVRKGLHAGERVVTDGLFALKSELFR